MFLFPEDAQGDEIISFEPILMKVSIMEPAKECKKRKRISEAERAATDLSKLVCELYKLAPRHTQERHARFTNNRAYFANSRQIDLCAESCNLMDLRQRPCYCTFAEFKFEAFLPDRDHLTRFSVSHICLVPCSCLGSLADDNTVR